MSTKMVFVAAALAIASLLCPTASRAAEKTENAQTVAAVKVAEVEAPKTTTTSVTCDAQCEQLRAAVEHLPKGGSSPSGDSAAEHIVLGGGAP